MRVYHYRRTPNPRTLSKEYREKIYLQIKTQLECGGAGGYCGYGAKPKQYEAIKAFVLYRFNPWIWADYVRWRRGLKSLLD